MTLSFKENKKKWVPLNPIPSFDVPVVILCVLVSETLEKVGLNYECQWCLIDLFDLL